MTTIADIPSVTATHLPTATSQPVPLGAGELSLTVLPPNPPKQPLQVLTLTVGSLSWPLLPITSVRKVQTKKEHATYGFKPAAVDGSEALGEVRISMKDSSNQGEWEATEALCAKFEAALKEHKVWDERTLFVNDEYETEGQSQKGWGETVASAVMRAGQAAAERLTAYTDHHITHTHPKHPPPPSEGVADAARSAKENTAVVAGKAQQGAVKVGEYIHEGGKKIGANLPDSIAKHAQPVAEHEKSHLRKGTESTWEQAKIAGTGIYDAAANLALNVSENVHRTVEHSFGKEGDAVAKDIGQAGTNVGSVAVSAEKATSVIIQGANASSGVAASKE